MTGTTFAPPRIEVERGRGGRLLVRSAEPLREHAVSVVHDFRAGSEAHPDRLLVAERVGGECARLTWGGGGVVPTEWGGGGGQGRRPGAGPARPRAGRPAGDGAVRQQPAAPGGRP